MVVRRKGLTPIIAMVLLLMLAIAAGGMLFAFAIKMQQSMQESVQKQMLTEAEKAAMRVDIVSIYDNDRSANTEDFAIALRNIGSTAWNMTQYLSNAITINGVPAGIKSSTCGNVNPNQVCTLVLNVKMADYNGEVITVIVNAPGNMDSKTCKMSCSGTNNENCQCIPP